MPVYPVYYRIIVEVFCKNFIAFLNSAFISEYWHNNVIGFKILKATELNKSEASNITVPNQREMNAVKLSWIPCLTIKSFEENYKIKSVICCYSYIIRVNSAKTPTNSHSKCIVSIDYSKLVLKKFRMPSRHAPLPQNTIIVHTIMVFCGRGSSYEFVEAGLYELVAWVLAHRYMCWVQLYYNTNCWPRLRARPCFACQKTEINAC